MVDLCVGHTAEHWKNDEVINIRFGMLSHVGPQNHSLDASSDPQTRR